MMEKVNAMKRDREEADSLHQAFIKAKEQNNLCMNRSRQLIGQSTGLRATMREQYQS